MEFLKHLNGSQIEPSERKDAEILYMKKAYREFLIVNKIERKIEDIFDPLLAAYMDENHPRWY